MRLNFNYKNMADMLDNKLPHLLKRNLEHPKWWPKVPDYGRYPDQTIERLSIHTSSKDMAKWKKKRLPGVQFYSILGLKYLPNGAFSAYCQYNSLKHAVY